MRLQRWRANSLAVPPLLSWVAVLVVLLQQCNTAHGIEAWWRQQNLQQHHYDVKLQQHQLHSAEAAAAWHTHTAAAAPRSGALQQQQGTAAAAARSCLPGCEVNGNCNRALGLCECAIGYTGPNCSQALWPSCRTSPQQQELYCATDWRPKSCACLRECAAFVCPDGTQASCERDSFDLSASLCFERPANFSISVDGVEWDGGSDLPEDTDTGVTYFRGRLVAGAGASQVSREEVVEIGPVDEIAGEEPLVALPASSCPLRCNGQGVCVQRKSDGRPFCTCHLGFEGEFCEEQVATTAVDNICWNRCQGRGVCRRGFCHCQPGWWGRDCSSSQVFPPHSAHRPVHKLRVYVYDLPWQVAYQPEPFVGFRYHDHNYQAYKVFGEMFMNDSAVRTENPWEANLFYIPAMTYAYSENTGDTLRHSRRAIDWVRQHWPFFNRSQGVDHFLFLTNDRGACAWPGDEEPALANIIKIVHFGWHHATPPGGSVPAGWEGQLNNRHWGCFHPLRDVAAAAYWLTQTAEANATYAGGGGGGGGSFNASDIPSGRLLFFAGGIRAGQADYSQGVRQQLHALFGAGQHPQVLIHAGALPHEEYGRMLATSKFCLAPSGFGWGIRLNHYIARGCVPVIVQDDIYQPYEDVLPYADFSVRLPRSALPSIVQLLAAISDDEYRALRAGLQRHWRAFVWDRAVGGRAYNVLIRSLKERMLRINARHIHALRGRHGSSRQHHDAQADAPAPLQHTRPHHPTALPLPSH